MKGIVLAGGANTRLYPVTYAVCKQLLPIYDKPMVYYPMSLLMLAGIRDILIISTPRDTPRLEEVFGDGAHLGLRISYKVQQAPRGIAEAFLVGADFIDGEPCALALGDNILFGPGLTQSLKRAAARAATESTIFGYQVQDAERYGVVEIGSEGEALSIEEKPAKPKSRWAVIGLYFYDRRVTDVARRITPSARGELEITDINRWYMEDQALKVERLGRGYAWLDAGTFDSLQDASEFVRAIQRRQGYSIACLEEIAFREGYIDAAQLQRLAEPLAQNGYGDYLLRLAESGPDF